MGEVDSHICPENRGVLDGLPVRKIGYTPGRVQIRAAAHQRIDDGHIPPLGSPVQCGLTLAVSLVRQRPDPEEFRHYVKCVCRRIVACNNQRPCATVTQLVHIRTRANKSNRLVVVLLS